MSAAFPTRDHIRTQQAIENYLGGSSKALQFVIDVLKHARDKSVGRMRFSGLVERNKFRPLFYCIMLQSFVMETGEQNYRKFGDSNLAASRNISLQRSLSELERSSSGGDITMKSYP